MDNLLGLSLAAQVSFGAGYAAYSLAYAGFRRHHSTRDAIFLTLAFGVPAILVFQFVETLGPLFATLIAVASSLIAAGIWRRWGRKFAVKTLATLRVHRDDGLHFAWDEIVQTDCSVGQISVHLKSGRVLYQNDRTRFVGTPWDGLYLGGDGSVVIAVEEEELPDGTEEAREGVTDAVWGTRMTYVPATEVARINIRMKA